MAPVHHDRMRTVWSWAGDVHNEDRSETNRELLDSVLAMVAVVVGGALGFVGAVWALRVAPDLPGIFAVPVRDRGASAPDVPLTYWLTWLLPPIAVYGCYGLVVWAARPSIRLR
jgi:nitrate reductase NapE component